MGEIISIQEQIISYEYGIGFTNGEERIVSVDQDKPGTSSAFSSRGRENQ
jgi:hypothetical protein